MSARVFLTQLLRQFFVIVVACMCMNNIRIFVPKHRDHAIVQHSCDVWASTGMLRISFEIIALYCLYLVICSLFRNGEPFIFFSTLSSFPLWLWEMVKNKRTSNKMHGATLAIKVAAVLRLERIENWIQPTWVMIERNRRTLYAYLRR